jgi:hypothetical protein
MIALNQNVLPPDRDQNPGPPVYAEGMLNRSTVMFGTHQCVLQAELLAPMQATQRRK